MADELAVAVSKYARSAWARESDRTAICSGSSSAILGRCRAAPPRCWSPRPVDPRVGALAAWAVGMAHRELGELEQARRPSSSGRGPQRHGRSTTRELAGEIAVSPVPRSSPTRASWPTPSRSWPSPSPAVSPTVAGPAADAAGDDPATRPGHFADAARRVRGSARAPHRQRGRPRRGAGLRVATSARCSSYLGRGDDARDATCGSPTSRLAQLDQTLIQALAAQNLAYVDTARRRLPAAPSTHFERAAAHYHRTDYDGPAARALRVDHARALLQAEPARRGARHRPRPSLVEIGGERERRSTTPEACCSAGRGPPGDRRPRRRPSPAPSDAVAAFDGAGAAGMGGAAPAPCCCGPRAADRARPRPRRRPRPQRRRARSRSAADTMPCAAGCCRPRSPSASVTLAGADELLRRRGRGDCAGNVMEQPAALRVAGARRRWRAGDRRRGPPGRQRRDAPAGRAAGRRSVPSSCGPTPPPTATGWRRSVCAWRSPTAGRGELLSHLEATRRTTSLLAVSRPPERRRCSPTCWPSCAASRAELREVDARPRPPRRARRRAAGARAARSATTSAGPRPAVRWPTSALGRVHRPPRRSGRSSSTPTSTGRLLAVARRRQPHARARPRPGRRAGRTTSTGARTPCTA